MDAAVPQSRAARVQTLLILGALGIMGAGHVSARLVGRVSPHRLLTAGLTLNVAGGLTLLAVAASIGLILPNATALPMALVIAACGLGAFALAPR